MKLIMESWKNFLLAEAAKNIDDVLADPNIFLYMLEGTDSDFQTPKAYFRLYKIDENGKSTNLAKIRIRKRPENCLGGWEVILSIAFVDKWGPLIYDIAMEYTGKDGLMADRDIVSEEAYDVWQYYLENRSDVKSKQLDWEDKPFITPDNEHDDCEQNSYIDDHFRKLYRYVNFAPDEEIEHEYAYEASPITHVYVKNGSPTLDALRKNKRIIRKSR